MSDEALNAHLDWLDDCAKEQAGNGLVFYKREAEMEQMSEISKNERASKVFGMRADRIGNAIIFDQPCELGYHCPVCVYEHPEGNYDERLRWSEYNAFLWCDVCNKDYPSALCMPDMDRAIDIFLDCVEEKLNEQELRD